MRSIDTGTARLVEDFVNMPKAVVQLAGMLLKKDWDLPYEAKFGRMYADWVAEGIPLEERIKKIEDPKEVTWKLKKLKMFLEHRFQWEVLVKDFLEISLWLKAVVLDLKTVLNQRKKCLKKKF